MKAIRLHRVGGAESLRYEEAQKPVPKDDQVLVRVHATAVTPTELLWYPTFHTPQGGSRDFPIILGHEFSGVVEAFGPACAGVEVGQSVYGLNDWFMDGAQADYCLTDSASVAPKPLTLDHVHAAVIPISALTAWQALIDRAHLAKGQRVLIHGGAGAVGSFAIQLARMQDAHVMTTVSAANRAFVTALGADEVIDYRTTPFETCVRDIDVVLDTVGGETRDRSWNVLKPGGQMVTVAAESEGARDVRAQKAFFIVKPNRVQLVEIARQIDDGILRPIVGEVFPMEAFRQAYEHKPLRGKHVLRVAAR